MKKANKERWKSWWSLSAKEFRALLYLIPFLAVVAWLIHELSRTRFEQSFVQYADLKFDSVSTAAPNRPEPEDSLFVFDPNTVSFHELCRLGFSRNQALGIIKYRAHGKVFEIPEDFASCYTVSEEMYHRLLPYLQIGPAYRLRPQSPESRPTQRNPDTPTKDSTAIALVPYSLDTASVAGLTTLGFSPRQAQVVLNYRDMKGGLHSFEEFAACYVVSEEMASRLAPYLVFPEPEQETVEERKPVELNSADSATLRSVYGIGPRTVCTIIAYRERLGGFVRVEQLAEVPGVTEQNFERIVRQITIDSCKIQKIDINFAGAKELGKHPYIPPRTLRKLLKERQLKGGWRTTEDLIRDKIFTPDEAARIAPYLLFREEKQPKPTEIFNNQ